MTNATRLKADDYARLHYDYTGDTDLQIIADTLDEKHDAGHLVWLYWPRMIAAAKSAKSFGWFETTPKKLASSVHDNSPWTVRQDLWELLVEHKRIVVRQGMIVLPSAKLDVLLTKVEKWSAWTPTERQKLKRYREVIEGGGEPHWTIRHLEEFCDVSRHSDSLSRDTPPVLRDTPQPKRDTVTQNGGSDTPLHFTSLHKLASDPEIDAALGAVADRWGRRDQWESHVELLAKSFPTATADMFAEALLATLKPGKGGQVERRDPLYAFSYLRGCVRKSIEQRRDNPVAGVNPSKADIAAMLGPVPGSAA